MESRDEILLEKYFARELSPAEEKELNDRLAEDSALAADLDWQKKVAKIIGADESAKMKAKLMAEEARLQQGSAKTVQMSGWKRILAVAAMLLAVLGAVWFLSKPAPQEDWVAQAFEPFPNRVTVRDNAQTPEQAAFNLYDRGDYKAAAAAFQTLQTADPKQMYAFYQGVALLGNQQYAAAEAIFEAIQSGEKSTYSTPTRYYLGIAYAGQGKKSEAKVAFEAYISDPAGIPYRGKARAALQKLME